MGISNQSTVDFLFKRKLIVTSVAAALGLTGAPVAIRQEASLEEIIVTATKKEESLQDISVSVTVVDGELIEKAAINSLQDLGRYVPNFSVSENAISTINCPILDHRIRPRARFSTHRSIHLQKMLLILL